MGNFEAGLHGDAGMKFTDQQLGMDANISRRDFLNGVSVAIGASLLPSSSGATDVGKQDLAGYYPRG